MLQYNRLLYRVKNGITLIETDTDIHLEVGFNRSLHGVMH